MFIFLSFDIFVQDIDSHGHFVIGKLASELIGCRKICEQNLVSVIGKIAWIFNRKYCGGGRIIIYCKGAQCQSDLWIGETELHVSWIWAYRFALVSYLEISSIVFKELLNLRVHLCCSAVRSKKKGSKVVLNINLFDISRLMHISRGKDLSQSTV